MLQTVELASNNLKDVSAYDEIDVIQHSIRIVSFQIQLLTHLSSCVQTSQAIMISHSMLQYTTMSLNQHTSVHITG